LLRRRIGCSQATMRIGLMRSSLLPVQNGSTGIPTGRSPLCSGEMVSRCWIARSALGLGDRFFKVPVTSAENSCAD
jgi:hypothetical protein